MIMKSIYQVKRISFKIKKITRIARIYTNLYSLPYYTNPQILDKIREILFFRNTD